MAFARRGVTGLPLSAPTRRAPWSVAGDAAPSADCGENG